MIAFICQNLKLMIHYLLELIKAVDGGIVYESTAFDPIFDIFQNRFLVSLGGRFSQADFTELTADVSY